MFRRLLPILMLIVSAEIFVLPKVEANRIQQLFEVGDMIDKMDTVSITCGNAECSVAYTTAAFFGTLWANKQQDEVNQLKAVLKQQDGVAVMSFMQQIATNKTINCPMCNTYAGWNVSDASVIAQQNAVDVKRSAAKTAVMSALVSTDSGKKLNAKIRQLKQMAKKHAARKSQITKEGVAAAKAADRQYLPGYFIRPNEECNFIDWIDGYEFPQPGRGVVQFTLDMGTPGEASVGFSPVQGTPDNVNDLFKVFFDVGGSSVQIQRGEDTPVSVSYTFVNPITIEIIFDALTERITVNKVETNGHRTLILNYDSYDSSDQQFFSFTSCDVAARIHDVQVNYVTYPSLKTLRDLSCVSLVAIQSLVDNNYLGFDCDGVVKAFIPEEFLGVDYCLGLFFMLTDNEDERDHRYALFFFPCSECCFMMCLPPEVECGTEAVCSGPFGVLPATEVCGYDVVGECDDMTELMIFRPEFSSTNPGVVYIKNVVTKGFLSNPHNAGVITTADLVGEPAEKGYSAQMNIKFLEDLGGCG